MIKKIFLIIIFFNISIFSQEHLRVFQCFTNGNDTIKHIVFDKYFQTKDLSLFIFKTNDSNLSINKKIYTSNYFCYELENFDYFYYIKKNNNRFYLNDKNLINLSSNSTYLIYRFPNKKSKEDEDYIRQFKNNRE
jgi:hypothetical protein